MSGHELILGTAGHIDHGKTALVKALTGIDTDRLEEEKRRGISIDIGFAHLDLGGRRLGVVDVPGHERFVRNMLAGASGIDIALLVVAADDSVMPQTREHLSILQLLQVPAGLVVITKSDLADESWLALVEEDVRALVAGTFLEGAPVVHGSVVSGAGLDEIKRVLGELCDMAQPRRAADLFRMHVDRSFALPGLGTVLTGTVWSGATSMGDEVECLPAGRRLRVRAAHSHGQDVQSVRQGQRAALNVSGARHGEIGRGDVVAAPGFLRAARTLTVRLYALAESPWPIRHRADVRLHIGTQEVMARIRLLEGTLLEPGRSGYAQLHAQEPVVAGGRQPFVVRSQSPLCTIGGGIVLETASRSISRRDRRTIERLSVLDEGDERARAAEVAWLARFDGVSAIDLCRELDLEMDRVRALLDDLQSQGILCTLALGPRRELRLHRERLDDVRGLIAQALERLHREAPLETAVSRPRLARRLEHLEAEIVMAVADRMVGEGALSGDEHALALPGFAPRLTGAQERLRSDVIEAYRQAGFSPPEPTELAKRSGVSDEELRPVLELCVGQHHLAHLGGGLYLHREREEELRRTMRVALAGGAALTVAEIRDMLGTSRKYAVPFCEYLDRIGLTRRLDDRRVLKVAGGGGRPAG